jgi:hypothetical protein
MSLDPDLTCNEGGKLTNQSGHCLLATGGKLRKRSGRLKMIDRFELAFQEVVN